MFTFEPVVIDRYNVIVYVEIWYISIFYFSNSKLIKSENENCTLKKEMEKLTQRYESLLKEHAQTEAELERSVTLSIVLYKKVFFSFY